MSEGTSYPSPRSESTGTSPVAISIETSKMALPTTQSTAENTRPRLAVRRTREPPKDTSGQLYCDHPDCRDHIPTFRRPCEWNKHMDKHDRPYKCPDPDCDKMQGFTYSGGLLRHQREVHKMHSKGIKLMCPYLDCNRSSGKGFTRQENLKEHLRRLHRGRDGHSPDMPISNIIEISNGSVSPPMHPAKRKRDSLSLDNGPDELGSNALTLRDEVTRLRREAHEKDARLDELEKVVAELRQMVKHR
ncbi:hypothetical protein AJ80_04765 [Polytolypa hystricis UAMH7299]|uniref:C2H2-type domain-containing protein n=1 Tax=Polytolypa hystricis (strain UAMH7299) TaxID=1447883 RepID=A0A2B7YAG4_POLH7|nr:hypothetical protein AJ80_04765 [Polytolypa hystricis UAMH7299]